LKRRPIDVACAVTPGRRESPAEALVGYYLIANS